MKVVLSRKGLDSTFSNKANMLIFDKNNNKVSAELVMLPIPEKDSGVNYRLLNLCKNVDRSIKICKALKQYKNISENVDCHADPNLVNYFNQKEFLGSMGQVDQSQSHLESSEIKIGDIFIFFGLFNDCAEMNNEIFVASKRQCHIMFGYMQVGDIVYTNKLTSEQRKDYEKKYPWIVLQPHWNNNYKDKINNCIYIARETCTFDKTIKGYGMFDYNKNLELTKKGEGSPTHWKLPRKLKRLDISYHTKENHKKGYFQAAMRGQEFVIEENKKAEKWAINLIKKYARR